MDRKHLDIFKLVLFIAGILLIGVIFLIVNLPLSDGISNTKKFVWINIVIMYVVLFLPFLLNRITCVNLDRKIAPAMGVGLCILLFELVAATVNILVLASILGILISIAVELVVAFLAGIVLYVGYFSGSHIEKVQRIENGQLSKLKELKASYESLELHMNALPDDFAKQKALTHKICEDARYLSPANSAEAESIEDSLIKQARLLLDKEMTPSEIDSRLHDIAVLIDKRKLLRK